MTTIAKLYPNLSDFFPSQASLDFLDVKRRNFIRSTLAYIQSAKLLTPFLRQRISRLIVVEKAVSEKTQIVVLPNNLIATLWQIYSDIADNNGCDFKTHLKSLPYKLSKQDQRDAVKLSHITDRLFGNLKNANRTRNTELQQFISNERFNSLSAIRHLQSRTNFKLNFLRTENKNLIPIVLSSENYRLTLTQCSTEQFNAARLYYKELLRKNFSEFYARVEIGLKLNKDYNSNEQYDTLIHCHAFVDASEYADFLDHAKQHRAKCRKTGVQTSLFRLKCKKLIKKQEKQTPQAFLSRELDYACKFACLEGTDGPDFYKAKVTRLDFSQVFHVKNADFINKVVLNNYGRSLLIKKRDNNSFSENKRWFKTRMTPEVANLIKTYQKLKKLKNKIKNRDKTQEPRPTPAAAVKPKIVKATGSKTTKFWQSFNGFRLKLFPRRRPRTLKPPN